MSLLVHQGITILSYKVITFLDMGIPNTIFCLFLRRTTCSERISTEGTGRLSGFVATSGESDRDLECIENEPKGSLMGTSGRTLSSSITSGFAASSDESDEVGVDTFTVAVAGIPLGGETSPGGASLPVKTKV